MSYEMIARYILERVLQVGVDECRLYRLMAFFEAETFGLTVLSGSDAARFLDGECSRLKGVDCESACEFVGE